MEWRWETPLYGAGGAKGAICRGARIRTTRSAHEGNGSQILCAGSDDGGKTWKDRGTIFEAAGRLDAGDGCLLDLGHGRLWFSFRRNDLAARPPTFAIELYESRDDGKTWHPHSTVARAEGERRGLWSSFLLRRGDGAILCLYDDEDTPHREGFPGHQWFTARTWNERARAWEEPVTVSRAHDPAHLSRDGMGSVVALRSGRLLCALESVGTDPLHASVVRLVHSDDGGRTWSWKEAERRVIVAAPRPRFAAYCPWLTRMPDSALVCVYATNEDRANHDAPGTPAHLLHNDIKAIVSGDDGQSWSAPQTLYTGEHRSYMPQVLPLPRQRVLCLLLEFGRGFVAVPGAPTRTRPGTP